MQSEVQIEDTMMCFYQCFNR